MDKLLINISGMACDHCRQRVEKAIKTVPGVSEVEVDLRRGTARVAGRDLLPTDVLAAISAAGYTATLM
ncbi:MAG: cation transporter [Muribaculaceae bacterium]|nr:cation transporter [Muribaculaceae bacterium]